MDKQTLEEIRTIICNEYLEKKDQILKNELSGEISSSRASEQRIKLIGMMTTVEIIQREIKKEQELYKYDVDLFLPSGERICYRYNDNNYIRYQVKGTFRGRIIERTISEKDIDIMINKYNKEMEETDNILDEIL